MAELSAAGDPRRAALLRKAVAQSKDQLISVRFERIIELIGKDQLSLAIDNQTELDQDLRAILELLMSENRAKSIEKEKARLRDYIKRLGELIRKEKDIQGRTLGGDEPKRLADEQRKLADRTGGLAKDMRKAEGGNEKPDRGKRKENEKENEKGKPAARIKKRKTARERRRK